MEIDGGADGPSIDAEWQAYFDLRWQVLRAPWNQPRGSEQDGLEDTSEHALIRDDARYFVRHFVFHQDVDPPARLRLQTNTGTVSGYERGETIVRDEGDWPLPGTKWTRLYLDGKASGSARSLTRWRATCCRTRWGTGIRHSSVGSTRRRRLREYSRRCPRRR